MFMLQEILQVILIGLLVIMLELNIKMKLLDKGILIYLISYVAALNILGRPTPLTDVPFFWTRQWDRTLAYSGVGIGFDEVIVDGDLS